MDARKVLVVLGHPNGATSFNGAIARMVCETLASQGYAAKLIDLYAEKFDPVMPYAETVEPVAAAPAEIQAAMAEVKEAAGLVFVHPNR